jgi:hypothetical protein
MAFYEEYEQTPMDVDSNSDVDLELNKDKDNDNFSPEESLLKKKKDNEKEKTREKVKVYKKKTIPKILKMNVWDFYIGKEQGSALCMCCNQEEIRQGYYEAGHVISERTGGTTDIDNLRPICSMCNKSMRIKNMCDFMRECGYKQSKNWYGIKIKNNNEIIIIE